MSAIKIQYLYNSGFTISHEDCFVVVDYFQGDLVLPVDREIYFIVTHAHADHYNPKIFTLPGAENAYYLLSDDVEAPEIEKNIIHLGDDPAEWDRKKKAFQRDRVQRLTPGEEVRLGKLWARSYGSTDQGISLLFELNGVRYFHAGDLNCWKWPEEEKAVQKKEEADYLKILKEISGEPIDIGFGVLDPRLKENAFLGPIYYLEFLRPQLFIPMHFRDQAEITEAFYHYYQANTPSRIQRIHRSGDRFIVNAQ